MRGLFLFLLILKNPFVIGEDQVFADESNNDGAVMAKRYERCLKLVHSDRPTGQPNKTEPVDLNDIVSIRSINLSGPHFASGPSFKMKPLLLWPNAIVPTDLEGQFTKGERDKIRCAMAFFHGFTCIRFVKRKPSHADYLLIRKSKSGCFSETVGKIEGGGYQVINLDQFNAHCWDHGTIVHELMHVVGRFHEHSRVDRKEHIHIHFNNIPQSDHFQFQTPKQMGYEYKDVGYYDYGSIMHYPHEIGGKRAISAAFKGDYDKQDRNQDSMGQRKRPSKQDEVKLNLLYRCNGHRTISTAGTKSTAKTTTKRTTTTTVVEHSDPTTKTPIWTPSNDTVCPYGALAGRKKFEQETFTNGEQIPHRYKAPVWKKTAPGWDTVHRTHSKAICQSKCQVDKDCVRSIWMPKNNISDCATTSWKAMQKDCATYNTRKKPTDISWGHWTPTCTESDPCIVKSLMCNCSLGLLKNEVAMIDLGVICGDKVNESANVLCSIDD